jgi:hypothetical protein
VVNKEVLESIQEFYEHDFVERSINTTFVVLIPKKVGPSDVKDFRPISLTGSIYKIISKVLANRLKEVLGFPFPERLHSRQANYRFGIDCKRMLG